MKKILLLGMSVIFTSHVFAQLKPMKTNVGPSVNAPSHVGEAKPVHGTANLTPSKKTRGGSRWYNQAAAVGNQNNTNLFDNTHYKLNYIWKDSTMLANYGGTQSNIWLKSIAQILDPKAFIFNDPMYYAGEIGVSNGTTGNFTVDSVGIMGIYTRSAAKPNVVDTLIVTIGTGNGTGLDLTFYKESQAFFITNYLDTGYLATPLFDFNTYTLKKGTASVAYTKKYLLTAASANDTTSTGWNYFSFPVTGVSCTPSQLPVMTVTFKSGDTWTPNVDSIGSNYNYFLFASSKEVPPAGFRYYKKGDYNISSQKENDTTGWGAYYIPSFYYNNPSYEFHWFDWKITCPTCAPVGVENVDDQGISVSLAPNPAVNSANLSLTLAETAENVNLQITNSFGAIVRTMDLGRQVNSATKNHKIDLSGLDKGVYIYTVIADGKKYSNKLIIE